ncbi:hypothetical protein GPECTOR_1g190 [Gonium pectorale]|uniref:Uncharacterized protein n=1 Tax=Gonium pectorale TaxID=33097 RepID=A0A150H251_GONPE|nr:hypothetical protein GPECTOR_1g190 [Gonium pectorale]|eukprot:KXZ56219.1 hypothetical protein GPECTOR_1g190 [Gonium pectorale]
MCCSFSPGSLGWCASWAASLLAACSAPGPELESLVLDELSLTAAESLQAPALAPLWELMRRCRRVEVQGLRADSAETAVRAARWLGKPTALLVACPGMFMWELPGLQLRPAGQSFTNASWPAAALAAPAANSQVLQLSGPGPGEVQQPSANAAGDTPLADEPHPLRQARGPAPSAAEVWLAVLRRLTGGPVPAMAVGGQATAGAACQGGGLGGGEAASAGPSGGESLLADTLPVAAAVRAVALQRGFGALLATAPLQGNAATTEYDPKTAYQQAVKEGMQSVWDGRVAECGGDPEAELQLMQRLLELGSQLVCGVTQQELKP